LVLTRAFVKRAVEYPPSGFEREIDWYYFRSSEAGAGGEKGALEGIVEQGRRLLEESERWLASSTFGSSSAAVAAGEKKEAAVEGEEEEEEEEDRRPPPSQVVPTQRVLTEGAGLSLRRTLKGLEELLKRGSVLKE
jgi:ubiquitin-conjugating enzyme E2 O